MDEESVSQMEYKKGQGPEAGVQVKKGKSRCWKGGGGKEKALL